MKMKLSNSRKLFFSHFFAFGTLLVVSFFRDNTFIALTLLSICSIALMLIDGNKKIIRLFFLGFILGPLAEAFCIHFGAWTYTNPFILGIPLYLPFVWGNATLYIKRLEHVFD